MHRRPSGYRRVLFLIRWLRRACRRPALLAPAVVLLVAAVLPLVVPARAGVAEGAPAVVEVSADTPLAHAGSDTDSGVGVAVQSDAQPGSRSAGPPEVSGPLAMTDREVLHKVKQAGLWEMPVGTWMNERAADAQVREAGSKIAAEHADLDGLVEDAAARLGVELPTEPSSQQQGWMSEIDARTGAAFDQRAVFLLRQAHGIVLPVLAQVRVATRNAVIREFTTQAMAFVQRHIQYLESTGLVDFEELPGVSDVTNPGWGSSALTYLLFALFTAVFLLLLVLVGRALAARVRARPGSRRSRATTPQAPARRHHARSYS
jgi:predicted outer membrane protein